MHTQACTHTHTHAHARMHAHTHAHIPQTPMYSLCSFDCIGMIKADRMMLTRHQFWSYRGDEGYDVNQTAMYSLCSSGPTEVMRVMLTRQPYTHSVVLVL